MGDQSAEAWTVDQQNQELKRRMGIWDMIDEKPSYKLDPDEVIVAMPPKNGKTWLLHICHQIRMKGQEPDFEDQWDVIYYIGLQSEKVGGVKPEAHQQPAKPRLFATHLPYLLIPDGGKRIFSFRDQKDAVISAYHHYNSFLILKGRISVAVFAQAYLKKVEKHINDLMVWWDHRHDKNVLLLFFDDLKEDHAGCVCRIAKFIGVDCNEDVISRVVYTTSHAEMSRHSSKFDTPNGVWVMSKLLGEEPPPESEQVGRVRKTGGKSGEGEKHLPPEIQRSIDQMWQEIVTPKLGFQDLNEMREAWKKELCSI